MEQKEVQRRAAESLFADEIAALKAAEQNEVPEGWNMSPRSVLTYILGGKAGDKVISPKYIGDRRLVEIAVATLLTDRSLLLIGEPGTAKSWLSEHLTAAINGDSGRVVQGTAGTTEEQIRYSWNYALLIAEGPSERALVKTPIFRAMEEGKIARFEEISRCAPEVQDALISLLSEKRISIPELNREQAALRGFSLIATANTRDKGVNEMSAALKRRFNMVILPSPKNLEAEAAVRKVCTVFRELRAGQTIDGAQKVKTTQNVLSTAEAISLLVNSMALAGSFGIGEVQDSDLAAALQGAIVKDEEKDRKIWEEYLEHIMKRRGSEWAKLYDACRSL